MTGRGCDRDPVAAALRSVWTVGHLVVLGLLAIVADHQLTGDPLSRLTASAPDTEAPEPPA
ncbi:hypothetical protein ACGFX4_37195 [Kitasatospora sp. NPDC048365]|uniref:hypothetical protein n=1 Tax=Kitasatospora sp. NPDC048365 TaxID=3364050 RepID=UPI003716673B